MNAKGMHKIEDLDVDDVVTLLDHWNMAEYKDFIVEKQLNGSNLMNMTEVMVKMWRPRLNANKFLSFVADLKSNPDKYLSINQEKITLGNKLSEISIETIECQYQTVTSKKYRDQNVVNSSNIEEIIKRIVPAQSFLYRNKRTEKTSSYVPMVGTPKKERKLFSLSYLSSIEYPTFDLRRTFTKAENFSDRGYYSIRTNNKISTDNNDKKLKYKSFPSMESTNSAVEDHFYEDLNYGEQTCVKADETKTRPRSNTERLKSGTSRMQEFFQSFKLPFFKKTSETVYSSIENIRTIDKVETSGERSPRESNVYENSDSIGNMYDSIRTPDYESNDNLSEAKTLPVEDYLEPIQGNKDGEYCDISDRDRSESLLAYILSMFESKFGIRRETDDDIIQSEGTDNEKRETNSATEIQKWNERKTTKTNMADRPLPVPVVNEPYYMDIDRYEAENLLKGTPDGTFILRPSSQSNHEYTLSVSCSNAVHNIGVRRRQDGRLALGYPRRGARTFPTITSLLRHHGKRRLLLVTPAGVVGATTLGDSPSYYQSPKSLPLS